MNKEIYRCRYCNQEYDDVPDVPDELMFCSLGCMENHNERVAERQLESYYGGDGPQTDRERYEIAAQEKRRIG